jgi:hypothetical protein
MTDRKAPIASVQLEMWHAERTTTSMPEKVCGAVSRHGRLDASATAHHGHTLQRSIRASERAVPCWAQAIVPGRRRR